MTNKINSVTTTVEYRTDTYDLGENFILEVFYENEELTSQKLKKSTENPKIGEYEQYPVLIDDISSFKQKIENIKFYETVGKDNEYWWNKHIVKNVLETIENGTFDIENLMYICTNDHSFRDREFKKFRYLKHFGYIDGFDQWSDDDEYPDYKPRFDWKKLGKYLKNHKNVKNLKEIVVPSYNADFYGQKAYEMDVLMEPEWGKVDCLFLEGHIDPLGVSQFLIEKKKKKKKKT